MSFIKNNTNIFLLFFYSLTFLLVAFLLIKNIIISGNDELQTTIITESLEEVNSFGLNTENLIEYIGTVQRNETLSDIFSAYNLNDLTPQQIAEASRETFNVRSIRAGKNFYAYVSDDSLNALKYFVYEKDPINYVVISLNDSLLVYEGQKKVQTHITSKVAEINNSLYATLEESDASPELAVRLSQIFAWQIDFYAIQKGDRFKVLYEEEYVDNKFVGIGKVTGAYFKHNGVEFYALPFEQDSVRQFFDENGKSLRKAFLKAPLEFSRISSRYKKNRFHPILKRNKPHLGTDYAAPYGTPIRTVGDGIVVEAGYSGGNGNYVKVKHNSVYTTQYLHMSKFAKGIKRGVSIKQGQIIGYVGSTGLATGPHLCFRFWKNGVQVDPFKEKIPSSHPVKKDLVNEFTILRDNIVGVLDSLKFDDEIVFADVKLKEKSEPVN